MHSNNLHKKEGRCKRFFGMRRTGFNDGPSDGPRGALKTGKLETAAFPGSGGPGAGAGKKTTIREPPSIRHPMKKAGALSPTGFFQFQKFRYFILVILRISDLSPAVRR
jgi:hypothetical protein